LGTVVEENKRIDKVVTCGALGNIEANTERVKGMVRGGGSTLMMQLLKSRFIPRG
jgi:membrane peptidoglycan carboxypeptidase